MKHEKSWRARMARWDEYAILKTAKEEGIQEGFEKGFKIGIELGLKKWETGVVRNLIVKMNLSDTQAAEVIKVPVDFVKKVRLSIKK